LAIVDAQTSEHKYMRHFSMPTTSAKDMSDFAMSHTLPALFEPKTWDDVDDLFHENSNRMQVVVFHWADKVRIFN